MPTIHKIDADTLRQWVLKNQTIILDVREAWEFEQGHIIDALNYPLSTLSLGTIDLPQTSLQHIVLYCKAGIRSQMACEKLLADGIEHDLWNYSGGFPEWKTLGFPQ